MVRRRAKKRAYLEWHYCNGSQWCVDHGQGILSSQQARVEETNTWNHNPDEGHTQDDKTYVAQVVHDRSAVGGVCNKVTSYWWLWTTGMYDSGRILLTCIVCNVHHGEVKYAEASDRGEETGTKPLKRASPGLYSVAPSQGNVWPVSKSVNETAINMTNSAISVLSSNHEATYAVVISAIFSPCYFLRRDRHYPHYP